MMHLQSWTVQCTSDGSTEIVLISSAVDPDDVAPVGATLDSDTRSTLSW